MSFISSLAGKKELNVPKTFGTRPKALIVEEPWGRNHTSAVNSMVHVTDKLDDTEIRRMTESLEGIPGVIAAQFRPIHKHMLNIVYNPGEIKAVELVNFIRMKGHPACLLGC